MRHERNLRWLGAAALASAFLAPSAAFAGELDIGLREHGNGIVVELRGLAPDAMPKEVITSKTGALLFLADQKSPVRRIDAPAKHRLRYVQVGQAGKRVAVRIVQRKTATGSLAKFLRTESVPGGLDVYVEDAAPKPVVAAAPTPPVAPPIPTERDGATTAALARLAEVEPVAPAPAPVASTIAAAPAQPIAAPTPAIAPAVPEAIDVVAVEPLPSSDDALRQASTTAEDPLAPTTPPDGRTMGWIALASLSAFGALALWRARRRRTPPATDALRVVSRVTLGPKQHIVWLVAGDRALLVGATEQHIQLIADLGRAKTDPVLDAPMPVPVASNDPAGGKIAAFKQRLRVAMGDEIAGQDDRSLPAHLELLGADPKWARKDVA